MKRLETLCFLHQKPEGVGINSESIYTKHNEIKAILHFLLQYGGI